MDGGLTERVDPARSFHAELRVPGDKSIAHRALMLAAIAQGESRIDDVPDGADVQATARCLAELGVTIHPHPALPLRGSEIHVEGRGMQAWKSPTQDLQCANSGTTMRLLTGLLAGSALRATLVGDASLQRRPMDRVVRPLRRMGARIIAIDGQAPLHIEGTTLTGVEHQLARPSAQVKSALLLAGLHASGETTVIEPSPTRDHTERLLRVMGAALRVDGNRITVRRAQRLAPLVFSVPGDFSSAAFLLGAAALRPGWSATVHGVGLNPSRTRFLHILRAMGANVAVAPYPDQLFEPAGMVTVEGARLRAVDLDGGDVAQVIDEVPLLLAMATQAEGATRVTGAGELRVKESDRLAAMADGLRRLGAQVEEEADGMTVAGPTPLRAATVDAHGDHRIAMALAVAALTAAGPVQVSGAASVAVSYPGFFEALRAATG
ncbi:MAG: 3-phosphoshikimate 1-carboxyvinyltransferase [Chloroflexi bacterium]|nr:MAG: 3-phosphoshikimate 1-carboxyvinyltransferase [Chloroflexota bacterium]